MNQKTDAPEGPEPFRPEDWISAAEAIRRVRNEALSPTSEVSIATRAHAGLLRSNAALLIYKNERLRDQNVPHTFWWARGYAALTQNWELGDFETWIDKKIHIQAFGVRFHRGDLDAMLGSVSKAAKPVVAATEVGGRPMSALWPDWVAELVMLIHDEGIPESREVENLINRVADRLAERDLNAPARTTVQDTARAVLRRLHGAGI